MKINDIFKSSDGGNIFKFAHLSSLELKNLQESTLLIPQGDENLTQKIRDLLNKSHEYNDKIGFHPDFHDMNEEEERKQYVVSVFADIQGSTNLVFKYDLSTVRKIKNRILTTAIEIFQGCDGHIHRLQGDAIFAYFGDKQNVISDTVVNALNACTILQTYINDYLRDQFILSDVDPVKLRIGIDLGYDDEVMWSKYGIKDCCEITTTSLHTDLAAKLQSNCSVNKIMIGENIVSHIDIPDEFLSIKTKKSGDNLIEKKYIIERSDFKYRMFQFEWEKYMRSFDFYQHEDIFSKIKLNCRYGTNKDYQFKYVSNSQTLPKHMELMFSIEGLFDMRNIDIEWTVINRGCEANDAGEDISFEMTSQRGMVYCPQSTKYTGHHYMRCIIRRSGEEIGCRMFGVYVHNDK